ncbi:MULTISPECIES: DUF1918 domain-containing protein [Rhodococcus]|uniref:DUF1918 domain-containing protein n=2 Tax=Rhodococcus opacus TaxID=37919 RepID=I0WNE6_RHOOP|nr:MULTISPECIES: DUF1918 domain-containing protein [Rhodococcus]EID77912.1 hypothetical protein W59_21213 [Rhodococcus opacus RKJ300 = JCM 13270]QDQ92662.1 DUF1918 domain-containing protein [Rhodococcus sp. WB9]QQZ17007.1 DUF1918 domain-containing protein [Rhodococcus sp. 21391]
MEIDMHAEPGDWLVVKGTVVDSPDEVGHIVEVRRADGAPPYLVRWIRDDHEALVFPGPDAHVVTAAAKSEEDSHERRRISALQDAIAGKPHIEQRTLRTRPRKS